MRTSSLGDETIEKYRRAGKIAKEVLKRGRELAREGFSALELVDRLEGMVRERDAQCAFPINICINEIAAHYAPRERDTLQFSRGDLVKIDVGVHIDGCIADTAATIEISTSNWSELMRASEEALNCALEMIAPRVRVGAIGAAIETAITSRGFKPICNLTGHTMERNQLHAGIAIPNIATKERSVLKSNTAVAIEPFATNGKGRVDGDKGGNIYQVIGNSKLRDDRANRFLDQLINEFDHLPFAGRWCAKFSDKYNALIRKHRMHRNLRSYPILSEVSSGMVAQSEHSTLILDNSVIVYTR